MSRAILIASHALAFGIGYVACLAVFLSNAPPLH